MSTDELLKPPFPFSRSFATLSETENLKLVLPVFFFDRFPFELRHAPSTHLNFASAIVALYNPESKMKNVSEKATQNTKQAANFVTARSGAS